MMMAGEKCTTNRDIEDNVVEYFGGGKSSQTTRLSRDGLVRGLSDRLTNRQTDRYTVQHCQESREDWTMEYDDAASTLRYRRVVS